MAVLTREKLERLRAELAARHSNLQAMLVGRDLKASWEGCKPKYHWPDPDKMRFIDSLEVGLALSDFKSVIKEIKKAAK